MNDFIKRTREDGLEEWENPNYDEVKAAAEAYEAATHDPITLSAEQIAADQLLCLRNMRDKKLAETDWSQGADVPNGLKEKYTTYRQALREVPQTNGDAKLLSEVVWPDKPS